MSGIDESAIFRIKRFLCCCEDDVPKRPAVIIPSQPLTEPLNDTARKRKRIGEKERTRIWQKIYPDTFTATCKMCLRHEMDLVNGHTWHVAHVHAWSQGGSDDSSNCRPLCASCNLSMGKKHFKIYCKENYPDRYSQIMRDFQLDP